MNIEDIVSIIIESNKKNQYDIQNLDEILISIELYLSTLRQSVSRSELSKYLYNVCSKLNNYSIPTPYIIEKTSFNLFSKTLRILEIIEIEVDWYDNISCLKIDELIWSIYNKISIPHTIEPLITTNYSKKNSEIKKPTGEEKLKEFKEHKNKLEQIILGYENKTLKTILNTTIPITPVKEKTTIRTQYFNLETEIILTPHFMDSGQSMLSSGNGSRIIPTANSQWQNGFCEVQVCINGLIDSSYPAENLSLPPDAENNNSPFIHKFLFDLIENICWNVYESHNHIGRWLIKPNDIGAITQTTFANNTDIYFSILTPPGQTLEISKQKNDKVIESNSITNQKKWFEKCLILAIDKLGIGNTNEAIFWLNVGIEALFEVRTRKICEQIGIDYNEFILSKSYWVHAKELVEKYITNEEANKIEWPTIEGTRTSWFSIIKNINKKVELKENSKKIISHYSKINKHRNAIFHGRDIKRIDGNIVRKAIESFIWIKDNYKIK